MNLPALCPTPADPTQVVRLEKLKLLSKAANLDSWHSSLQLALAQRPWLSAPPATLAQLTAAGAAAAAAQQQQPGPARPGPPQAGWGVQPDQLMVHELTTMGFPARHAANALIATNNAGTCAGVYVDGWAGGVQGLAVVGPWGMPGCPACCSACEPPACSPAALRHTFHPAPTYCTCRCAAGPGLAPGSRRLAPAGAAQPLQHPAGAAGAAPTPRI